MFYYKTSKTAILQCQFSSLATPQRWIQNLRIILSFVWVWVHAGSHMIWQLDHTGSGDLIWLVLVLFIKKHLLNYIKLGQICILDPSINYTISNFQENKKCISLSSHTIRTIKHAQCTRNSLHKTHCATNPAQYYCRCVMSLILSLDLTFSM